MPIGAERLREKTLFIERSALHDLEEIGEGMWLNLNWACKKTVTFHHNNDDIV